MRTLLAVIARKWKRDEQGGLKLPVRSRRRDRGQGLIEYTLLVAFVGLAVIALMSGAGTSTAGIWGTANSQLDNANGSLGPPTHRGDDHAH